jgi:hypothetical protein
VRWGLIDVFGWLALAIVASTAWTLLVATVGGYSIETPEVGESVGRVVGQLASGVEPDLPRTLASAPLSIYVLGQLPLWGVFIGGAVFSTRRRGNGFVRDLRWRFRRVDVPVGLAVGVAFQVVAVPLLYRVVFLFIGEQDVSAEARELTDRATGPLSFLMLVIIVGIGAPIAEEIFYRGLALGAMQRRWGATWGLVASSGLFALTHNQPLQFPALLAFGLVLGWMVQRTGRLGPAVWAHLGFNMTAALALVLDLDLPG